MAATVVKKETKTWKTLTDDRVIGIINKCIEEVTEMGYKVPEGIKFKTFKSVKTFGICSYREHALVLNEQLLKEDENCIRNTVMHELAHFIAGSKAKHGPEWKKVANRISVETGLNISRTNSFETHPEVAKYREENIKYKFKCRGCGCTLKYTKKTEFVRTYADTFETFSGEKKPRWTCSRCGNTFEMVKGEE